MLALVSMVGFGVGVVAMVMWREMCTICFFFSCVLKLPVFTTGNVVSMVALILYVPYICTYCVVLCLFVCV